MIIPVSRIGALCPDKSPDPFHQSQQLGIIHPLQEVAALEDSWEYERDAPDWKYL